MCPMRFILVFFSAILAGYLAWRTVQSSEEAKLKVSEDSTLEDIAYPREKHEFSLVKMIQDGFWVFVDMASGRYLWRNLTKANGE